MILSVMITLWGVRAILTTGITSVTFTITGMTPFKLYILSNIFNIGLLLVVSTFFFLNCFHFDWMFKNWNKKLPPEFHGLHLESSKNTAGNKYTLLFFQYLH